MNFQHYAPYLYAGFVWGILSFCGVALLLKMLRFVPSRRWFCYKCRAEVVNPNVNLPPHMQVCDRCWEKRIGLSSF
jgi:hypothetical protein